MNQELGLIFKNMIIKLSTAIYIGITVAFIVWFLVDFFSVHYGGQFSSGKKSGEMSLLNGVQIIIFVAFTLIYAGIFWW